MFLADAPSWCSTTSVDKAMTTHYDSHVLTHLKWMNACRYKIYPASPKNKPWSHPKVPFVCSNYSFAKITKVNPTTHIKTYWHRQAEPATAQMIPGPGRNGWLSKWFLQKGKGTLSVTTTKTQNNITVLYIPNATRQTHTENICGRH